MHNLGDVFLMSFSSKSRVGVGVVNYDHVCNSDDTADGKASQSVAYICDL